VNVGHRRIIKVLGLSKISNLNADNKKLRGAAPGRRYKMPGTENIEGSVEQPDIAPRPLQSLVVWLFLNGFMGFMVFNGLFLDKAWAVNILLFGVWTLTIVHTCVSFSDEAKTKARQKGPSIPRWLSIGFDLTIIVCLASFGRFFSAAAWTWQMLCESRVYDE
jgi:hypothetical protein